MPETANILPFKGRAEEALAAIKVRELGLLHDNKPLLNRISVDLSERGVTGLLGPNGAGKTLFLRVLMGLVPPSQGAVDFGDGYNSPALVFQQPVLLRRSVQANLIHALKIAGVARKARSGRLAELLVAADLAKLAETPARALSGGEQQRLAIVRALASNPSILLLDEPTASLDPNSTKSVEDLILATAGRGVKIVLVTHDRKQAARLCDDILFLHNGIATEHTAATTFFEEPHSKAAKSYLAGDLLL